MIVGGRAPIRRILYMATVAAVKHNPVIQAFHRRLRAAGRPGKVALTAAMRKLLTILNAMLRDRRPWQLVRLGRQSLKRWSLRETMPVNAIATDTVEDFIPSKRQPGGTRRPHSGPGSAPLRPP